MVESQLQLRLDHCSFLATQMRVVFCHATILSEERCTWVLSAAGVESGGGTVKLKPSSGKTGSGPPPKKVSVQDMISEIQVKYAITDEEALYIKQVTEENHPLPSRETLTQ